VFGHDVAVAERRVGRVELWGGWSIELPSECVLERSAEGPWAAWDDKHSIDVQIVEVGGHESGRPMAPEEMLGGPANKTGNGWIGSLEMVQEDDAGQVATRYALSAAAQNTWISCWVSYLEPAELAWAEQVAAGLQHTAPKSPRFRLRRG
jgi:hypothetical protein